MKKEINLNERGTGAVMEWIAANRPSFLSAQIFSHKGEPFLIVSDEESNNLRWILNKTPLDQWHDIDGCKRVMIQVEGAQPHWYFYINGKFYFASLY